MIAILLQFTTGSVEDRQRFDIHLSVQNAGIQPANAVCRYRSFRGDRLESSTEHKVKIPPRQEATLLNQAGLKEVHCEVALKVDSPSLIITVKGEARYPVHLHAMVVDDIEAPWDESMCRSVTLLWGYTNKGEPF